MMRDDAPASKMSKNVHDREAEKALARQLRLKFDIRAADSNAVNYANEKRPYVAT